MTPKRLSRALHEVLKARAKWQCSWRRCGDDTIVVQARHRSARVGNRLICKNENRLLCARRLFPTHGIVVIHSKRRDAVYHRDSTLIDAAALIRHVVRSSLLPPPSSATPSTSPATTLMPLLEASALLTSRSTGKAAHALSCHLHERGKIHLTGIHALLHHVLHHHLHLLLIHTSRSHGTTPAASCRPCWRHNARSSIALWATAHARHTRHRCTTHHSLHLCHVVLLTLEGVRHADLPLAIQLPGKLVETIVEVIRLVFAGSAPDLLLFGQIGINVYAEYFLALGRVNGVAIYVDGRGALHGEGGA